MSPLDHLAIPDAASNLDRVLTHSRMFTDPHGAAAGFTCAEADAFADLLRAVGLDRHAADLITQHAAGDEPDDHHAADNPNAPSGGGHP